MHEKVPLERLGIKSAKDLCALKTGDGDTPLSLRHDLRIAPPITHKILYKQPEMRDAVTFWQESYA